MIFHVVQECGHNFFSFCHILRVRQTDGHADIRAERPCYYSALRYMQSHGEISKNVKALHEKNSEQ